MIEVFVENERVINGFLKGMKGPPLESLLPKLQQIVDECCNPHYVHHVHLYGHFYIPKIPKGTESVESTGLSDFMANCESDDPATEELIEKLIDSDRVVHILACFKKIAGIDVDLSLFLPGSRFTEQVYNYLKNNSEKTLKMFHPSYRISDISKAVDCNIYTE